MKVTLHEVVKHSLTYTFLTKYTAVHGVHWINPSGPISWTCFLAEPLISGVAPELLICLMEPTVQIVNFFQADNQITTVMIYILKKKQNHTQRQHNNTSGLDQPKNTLYS